MPHGGPHTAGEQIRQPIADAAGEVKDFIVDDVPGGLQTAGTAIANFLGLPTDDDDDSKRAAEIEPAPGYWKALKQAKDSLIDPAIEQYAKFQADPSLMDKAMENYWNSPDAMFEGMYVNPNRYQGPIRNATKDPLNPFDLTAGNIAADMTPEDLEYYKGIEQFVQGFNQKPSTMKPYKTKDQSQGQGGGGSFTDPFGNKISSLEAQRRAQYEALFAGQEGAAADKYESITAYLDDLGAGQQEQYQIDMANLSQQYEQMQSSRDERFAEAYATGADRSGLALDTLASLGIEPDLNTFSSITGETRDMLFSQQQSGADMLNTMRLISNQMLDFGASSASKTISAGLQQAEMNFAEEMANIQLARHSQAINDLDAQIAQEKANQKAAATLARAKDQEAKMNQYYVTLGASLPIPLGPAEAIAAGNTGAFDYYLEEAFAPLPEEPTPESTYQFGGMEEPLTAEGMRLMMEYGDWLGAGQQPPLMMAVPGQVDEEGNPTAYLPIEDWNDFKLQQEIANN